MLSKLLRLSGFYRSRKVKLSGVCFAPGKDLESKIDRQRRGQEVKTPPCPAAPPNCCLPQPRPGNNSSFPSHRPVVLPPSSIPSGKNEAPPPPQRPPYPGKAAAGGPPPNSPRTAGPIHLQTHQQWISLKNKGIKPFFSKPGWNACWFEMKAVPACCRRAVLASRRRKSSNGGLLIDEGLQLL